MLLRKQEMCSFENKDDNLDLLGIRYYIENSDLRKLLANRTKNG
jgi:hypothetical protein